MTVSILVLDKLRKVATGGGARFASVAWATESAKQSRISLTITTFSYDKVRLAISDIDVITTSEVKHTVVVNLYREPVR